MDARGLKFQKLTCGETEWLIKPYREDGRRITDAEIDEIMQFLATIESRNCSSGEEPLSLQPN